MESQKLITLSITSNDENFNGTTALERSVINNWAAYFDLMCAAAPASSLGARNLECMNKKFNTITAVEANVLI